MHDLSLYLLDILENSVRAGATIVVTTIVADRAHDELSITVEDDGPGLPVEPEQALDPFYTTKPNKKTGLGLSLFRQAAEAADGWLTIGRSHALGGAIVHAEMSLANVDRPPLGDVAASLVAIVVTNPDIEFRIDIDDDGSRTSLCGPELPQRFTELVAFQEALP